MSTTKQREGLVVAGHQRVHSPSRPPAVPPACTPEKISRFVDMVHHTPPTTSCAIDATQHTHRVTSHPHRATSQGRCTSSKTTTHLKHSSPCPPPLLWRTPQRLLPSLLPTSPSRLHWRPSTQPSPANSACYPLACSALCFSDHTQRQAQQQNEPSSICLSHSSDESHTERFAFEHQLTQRARTRCCCCRYGYTPFSLFTAVTNNVLFEDAAAQTCVLLSYPHPLNLLTHPPSYVSNHPTTHLHVHPPAYPPRHSPSHPFSNPPTHPPTYTLRHSSVSPLSSPLLPPSLPPSLFRLISASALFPSHPTCAHPSTMISSCFDAYFCNCACGRIT
jgi:hypothetical protein